MPRILFCNIAYMKRYKGITNYDIPINGGEYVRNKNDALEKYSFYPLEDGTVKGFVETKHRNGYDSPTGKPNQLHIEKIDNEAENKDQLEDVVVVFSATMPNIGRVIVGWYDHATVFRYRPSYERNGETIEYNLLAKSSDAHLIDEKDRSEFRIPKARLGEFGFGQSNVKYVSEDQDYRFAEKVIQYLDSIRNDRIAKVEKEFASIDSFTDISETEKAALVKLRIGQSSFRTNLINRDGRCRICGLENKNLLVASHIKEWSNCSTGEERMDSDNGLLLCSIHDALFDGHMITFDNDGSMIVSHEISDKDLSILGLNRNYKLVMNEKMKKYMSFHRKQYMKSSRFVEHAKWGIGIISTENKKDDLIDVVFLDSNEKKSFKSDALKNGILKKC